MGARTRTIIGSAALAAALVAGAASVVPVESASAASSVLATFTIAGTTSYIVPATVCGITVTIDGGHGGAGFDNSVPGLGGAGGAGARVSADFAIAPGAWLVVQVGGPGGSATSTTAGAGGVGGGADGGGGANTGGGGGGASLVAGAVPLIVSGGGGGGGGNAATGVGNRGGRSGVRSDTPGPAIDAGPGGRGGVGAGNGGGGGGLGGGSASGPRPKLGPVGGAGGASGGAGGTGDGTHGGGGGAGANTGGGPGGAGGLWFSGGGGGSASGGGGGGAGSGGGGGGAIDAGGGAGSMSVGPGATNLSVSTSARTGVGQVVFSYDPASDVCLVVAPVGHVPPIVHQGPTTRPLVALSIDDINGVAGAQDVNAVMDVLAAKHVKGITFFPLGEALTLQHLSGYDWVWRRVARSGSEIGNHTYTHPNLTRLSNAQIRSELASTQAALNTVLGAGFAYQMHLMRPPGGNGGMGNGDPRLLSIVNSMGYSLVMWSIDSNGTTPHGPFVAQIIRLARPGSIVLMHFTGVSPADVGSVIDGLRRKGLEPTTVTSLFP